ncbi:MAG: threo-3-hydroxy-L-aspartate ammonia-lyase [Vicinamibacterales bacterium]
MTDSLLLPASDDVQRAARQIAGAAHRTPVVTSRTINALVGAEVFFKAENLQRSGSFKFRGAFNALSRLSDDQKARGIITYSSGNHAQAIALAGHLLDIPRTIVMPADAPAVKKAATRAYGGAIIEYDPMRASREAVAQRLAHERGLTLVPPFDHADVIAGQGTAALELIEDTGALDLLLVPCGGGGLLAGSALITTALTPACRVIGVEPATADDATQSFRTGALQTVDRPTTVADGARTPSLGALTFPLVLANVADMTTVDDPTLLRTMFFLWERLKLVVEPTGALAAAALLDATTRATIGAGARRIGVILSGGNAELSAVPYWRSLL